MSRVVTPVTTFINVLAVEFLVISTTAVTGLLAVESITTLTGNCVFVGTLLRFLTQVLHSVDTFNLFRTGSAVCPDGERFAASSSGTASSNALHMLVCCLSICVLSGQKLGVVLSQIYFRLNCR